MKLTSRELATVLAALRYWQGDSIEQSEGPFAEYFTDCVQLNPDEIDSLCERLNVTEDPDQMVLACPECKSSNVQSQYWVHENTREVLDPTERYSWCNNCEEAGNPGEIRFVDLVYIKRSETFEANLV